MMRTVWIFRADGEMARVTLEVRPGEGCWPAMARAFPVAWRLVEDEAAETDSQIEYDDWSADFAEGQDEDLARWLAEGMETVVAPLADDEGCKVGVTAFRREGLAEVVWRAKDGTRYHQTILLDDGDFEAIAMGIDPVAEGWEDGAGSLVCYDNAEEFR